MSEDLENRINSRAGDSKVIDLNDTKAVAELLFRRTMLESIAKKQDSKLYCPHCKTNLPITMMTVDYGGSDDPSAKIQKENYFCTICEEYF